MKKILCFILLAIVAFIVACKQNETVDAGTAINEGSEPANSNAARVQTSPLHAVHRYDGISFGSGNKDGFYFVDTVGHANGSTNLMYLDYATMQKIYLCSQPNCTHQTETCTSYIPPNGGGAVPVVIGEKLVLVFLGNSFFEQELGNAALPRIEVMSLDGSNRKLAATFAANQSIEKPFLADAEHLYFRLSTVNAEKTNANMMQLNAITGELVEMIPLNTKKNERIWGCTETQIVLYRYTSEIEDDVFPENLEYEIALLDINTLDTTSLYTWSNSKQEPALFSDSLVFFDMETSKINVLNLQVPQGPQLLELPHIESIQDTDVVFHELKDNRLIYSVRTWKQDGTGIETYDFFTWDFKEQTSKTFSLLYSFQEELSLVTIVASPMPNAYLVIKNETMVQAQQVGEDGVNYSLPAPTREYALIQKDDFWNGRAIYNTFSF